MWTRVHVFLTCLLPQTAWAINTYVSYNEDIKCFPKERTIVYLYTISIPAQLLHEVRLQLFLNILVPIKTVPRPSSPTVLF